jgi:hypothetical protein
MNANKYETQRRWDNVRQSKPYDKALQFEFGRIMEFDEKTNQVMVQLVNGVVVGGEDNKRFFPLINALDDIELRWGKLRKNLAVRVWWRGEENDPREILVEIIGPEDLNILQQPVTEDADVGVYKICSPGII